MPASLPPEKLPIDPFIPQILQSLESCKSLVLQASPGSGKTTRVPPAILKRNLSRQSGPREILVLEPRRVAAKYAARRVSEEWGTAVGQEIGYQFRFENQTTAKTQLRFLTEGMLMRKLLSDPKLERVCTVFLDEFHERHLQGDIALGYLKQLQSTTRPDLEIIVMSATLDSEPISQFLAAENPCPVITIEAPIFPVETTYLKSAPAKHLDFLVKEAVIECVSQAKAPPEKKGDILVFLPGMADIRRAAEALREIEARYSLLVTALHGELSKEEQDTALGKSSRRKIILSTNLAETSLTIPGVSIVIDSGLHRQASYSSGSGVPSLRTRPISRASAIQRAGRAGRTGPGRCIRLYTKGDFDGRAPFDTPEIERADLTQTVLELKALGVKEVKTFPWFEIPPGNSLSSSEELLKLLGAIDPTTQGLTPIGHKMTHFPAHPRIARMLIEAEKSGADLDDAILLAALIAEGELSQGNQNSLDALTVLSQVKRSPAVNQFRRVTELFREQFKEQSRGEFKREFKAQHKGALNLAPPVNTPHANPAGKSDPDQQKLRFAVLAGFPDRVAKKKLSPTATKGQLQIEAEILFATGGSVKTENSGVIANSDFFIALDMQERQHQNQVRSQTHLKSVIAIEPEWLFDLPSDGLLVETEEAIWDRNRERIDLKALIKYGDLVISEGEVGQLKEGHPFIAKAAQLLLKNAVGVDLFSNSTSTTVLPSLTERIMSLARLFDPESFESVWVRFNLALKHSSRPQLTIEDLDRFVRTRLIEVTTQGAKSLKDLQAVDWNSMIIPYFDPEGSLAVNNWFPTHFELPNKRRTPIQYKVDQAPWIGSRLQDFFGVKEAPAIAQGKIKLTLHLLAPNQRALQVTTDLPGFWVRTYPEVRKELCRKYPRHSWPENPLIAEALAPGKR